ncbi:MAG: protoporphyrinogen/coproporphyrinogen oxidase [Gemmatimonadales bacterium]
MTDSADVVILGGGVAGLATASVLGSRALVLERGERPGGLVRTENFGGYWFDHVIHLLYFADPEVQHRVLDIVGQDLQPCPPLAYVELSEGAARFPFQIHLADLPAETALRCLRDFAVANAHSPGEPRNYAELLRQTFGKAMCEMFFFPYNRKTWRRPLESLAADGFHWNLTRPDMSEVLQGALHQSGDSRAYNARGWYPRPAPEADQRGMEVLTRSLASRVSDLRLHSTVTEIDLEARAIRVQNARGESTVTWRDACVSTLPLPQTVSLCRQAPIALRRDCAGLSQNRVRSVALSIRGPRPHGTGHWRYYADEALCFTRLVYMCEFDPALAPADGWGLLVEVPERGEDVPRPAAELVEEVVSGLESIRALSPDCRIIDRHVIDAEPAYVVFTPRNAETVRRAQVYLREAGVEPLGRYGRWEYSSMAQVMTDGFRWADEWLRRP